MRTLLEPGHKPEEAWTSPYVRAAPSLLDLLDEESNIQKVPHPFPDPCFKAQSKQHLFQEALPALTLTLPLYDNAEQDPQLQKFPGSRVTHEPQSPLWVFLGLCS